MAKALIDSLTSDFDAGQYRDEYREELLALIERKANGEALVSSEIEAPKPTKAPDLMAALEESLAAVKAEESAAPKPTEATLVQVLFARRTARQEPKPKSPSRSRSKAKASK